MPCSFCTVSGVKYGVETKCNEEAQVFLKGFCALKIVAGHVAGGESVWLRAVCGEKIHRAVAVRQVEHLVLKKMRHARRGVDGLAVQLKAPVGSAVIRGEGGVEGRKALLRDDAEPESVRSSALYSVSPIFG